MQKILLAAIALAIVLPATADAKSVPQHRFEMPFKVACTQTGCQRIAADCQEKHGPDGIVPRGFDTIKCNGAKTPPGASASREPWRPLHTDRANHDAILNKS